MCVRVCVCVPSPLSIATYASTAVNVMGTASLSVNCTDSVSQSTCPLGGSQQVQCEYVVRTSVWEEIACGMYYKCVGVWVCVGGCGCGCGCVDVSVSMCL